ncbi:hypothetical protein [Roseomonas mucosa]|uniref:hypothetical protein n=1 Tax=Roseomonas mucosa TaxID=207340 RepID=UPI003245C2B7
MGQRYREWLAGLDDRNRAMVRLGGRWSQRHWGDTGFFDVPAQVLRALVDEGYAESRKPSPSCPTEYRGLPPAMDAARPIKLTRPPFGT